MPHCTTIAHHTAITVWERLWPSGDPATNFTKALEAETAKAFKVHTGEDLDPGIRTLAYAPIYDDSAPKPLIITIHAWWNRRREGRRQVIAQSVNEWLCSLDSTFVDAVVNVIIVGAWKRKDPYENTDAMPVFELLELPAASSRDYPYLETLNRYLEERDIRYVGELIQRTADELSAQVPRLTPHEIIWLRAKLSGCGLALRGEEPIPALVPAEL